MALQEFRKACGKNEMSDSDEPKIEPPKHGLAIDMSDAAVEERFNKVWQLTIEAWAKKGIDITKLPMRRDVERLTHLHEQ